MQDGKHPLRSPGPAAGMAHARRNAAGNPDEPTALAAFLTGLWECQRMDELAEATGRIRPVWLDTPAFAEHVGRAAFVRRDWPAAASALRRVWEAEPHRIYLAYPLTRALRLNGQGAEADRIDARIVALRHDSEELLSMYRRLLGHPERELRDVHDALKFAGGASAAAQTLIALYDPVLLRRFAELREDLGFHDQARAWRLALAELFPSAR